MALEGILHALRADYAQGTMRTYQEHIHANLFADFLAMADQLLEESDYFKAPAATLAGGVLEEHLRKLCDKYSIATARPDGRPKSAEAMNNDLRAQGAYNELVRKAVALWYGIREARPTLATMNTGPSKYGA